MPWLLFQSSAGFDPGRYVDSLERAGRALMFQSSAGFDPGRYLRAESPAGNTRQFQSSAGFDPGRYREILEFRAAKLPVSILGRV